jgi:hypothetical protein
VTSTVAPLGTAIAAASPLFRTEVGSAQAIAWNRVTEAEASIQD